MYYIVYCVGGWYRAIIDTSGQPNKYGKPKLFKTKKAAQEWINRKSYKGMTESYEIKREN